MKITKLMAKLARVCEKDSLRCRSMDKVLITRGTNGAKSTLKATDGRVAIIMPIDEDEADIGISDGLVDPKILIEGAKGRGDKNLHEPEPGKLRLTGPGVATTFDRALADGSFPDVDAVMPKAPALLRVGLNIKLLATLAAAVSEDSTVFLKIPNPEKGEIVDPIVVEAFDEDNGIVGVIMPMNPEK